ncbi:MAG: transglycosylase domain-containing protein [Leptospiraceae bacterium]|nr:transglycosylase domain-containing protein [Leptospiraceae bacterium]MCP5493431.1 transglycosylase domain-containing protein [Leptospiraceae bacterium]
MQNKRKSIFKKIITIAFIIFFLGIGTTYCAWFKERSKVIASLEKYNVEVAGSGEVVRIRPIRIFDINQKLIGEFSRSNYKPIRKDNLHKHGNIVWALLSAEDREFFNHSGINYIAILRAVFINLLEFRVAQGGSTITQQLAKLTLSLGERNIFNKAIEAYCTYYIERNYDKKTILSMYMNQIFMGEGNTGLEEAARYYFNKPAMNLGPEEAAMLVGIIPAPSIYNPVRNLSMALERQRRILYDMSKNQDLHFNPEKIDKNFANTIEERIRKFKNKYRVKSVVNPKKKDLAKGLSSDVGKYGYDRQFRVNLAPDFNESIRSYIFERFTVEELEKKELNIYTTLNIDKQKIAETALREGIDEVKRELQKNEKKSSKKKKEQPSFEKEIMDNMNGSVVSLNPYNGYVEVLIGSYKLSSIYRLNRAEEAQRQPGSAIKGFVYALALEKRIINPSSIVVDEKINFNGYSPRNWYKGYKGDITIRYALAQSVNTISVKLLKEIGVDYFLNKLSMTLSIPYSELKNRMGKNLSLALGSGELTPMEMAIVYSTIANGGRRIVPRRILRITDDHAQDLLVDELSVIESGERILDPVACAMTINLMESVTAEGGTMPVKFSPNEYFPVAGKTGTVQTPPNIMKKWRQKFGIRDAWFVGILPANVTTVWVGNDQGAPFPGSGSKTSGRIWLKYAYSIKRGDGGEDYKLIRPFDGDYVRLDICGDNGYLLSDFPDCTHPLFGQYYFRGDEPFSYFQPNYPNNTVPPDQQQTPPITQPNTIDNSSQGDSEGIIFEEDKNEVEPEKEEKPEEITYPEETEKEKIPIEDHKEPPDSIHKDTKPPEETEVNPNIF